MYDVVIIGSGPAGLSAAVYAKRAMLNAVVIEKEYMGTGQIAVSERVDNYLGLYGESGFDLGEKFRTHAEKLGTEFIENEVVRIDFESDYYVISLADRNTIQTKTIVLATGANPKKLGIRGELEFSGKGVSYCAVCDSAFYKDKVVAVAGGGDTALNDAVVLSNIAKSVYLIHRRDEFRANKTLQKKVNDNQNITQILNANITEILGDKKVSVINILHNGKEETLEIDGVFVAVGVVPNSDIVKDVLLLDENGYVIANEDGKTSAKGIFVAGDVRTKHLRQVATAVSDGANCISSVEEYINNCE